MNPLIADCCPVFMVFYRFFDALRAGLCEAGEYGQPLQRLRRSDYVHASDHVIDLNLDRFFKIRSPQSIAVDVFFKIRNPQANAPQFIIAYVIFPGEVALSAIGEFQIKEVANYEANGDADFPDFFGGG